MRKGFTVVEVIVVIVIIGIVLTVGMIGVGESNKRNSRETAVAAAERVKIHLSAFYSEKDRYPVDREEARVYLATKDAELATTFSDTVKFDYAPRSAADGSCSLTLGSTCKRYTITVKAEAWGDTPVKNIEVKS